ncbi:MAG: glycosyltransferase [Patescibacteria group bacterium UBA2103]
MKVLLVITKGTWGGATKYVYDVARSLNAQGIIVAVAYGPTGELSEKLKSLNIPQYHIEGLTRDLGFFQELRAYKGILKIIDEFEPDIVHVNSSKAGIAALAARLRGKKVIFTVHGWAFNERRNFLFKIIFKAAYFTTMLLAHKTILVSEALRKPIRHWPFVQKVAVIPNGIAPINFLTKEESRKELAEIQPSLKKIQKKTWILTIAELHDSKGIDVMLSALTALKETSEELPHYVVIGEGDERWRLEKLIDTYNLHKNVHLVGFVENAAAYLKAADIFVLPSRTEALGYVLIEAGMANLPVIATRVGGIPEVIEHNKTGLLVPPNSSNVLSTALSILLKDVHKQKELSLALQLHTKEKFSLDTMISDTQNIYKTS